MSIAGRTASLGLLLSLVACTSLPDWSPRETREMAVIVHYEAASRPRTVVLPRSTRDLSILELEPEPGELRQTYVDGRRLLHLPGDSNPAHVRCRYRVYRDRPGDGGPLEWPRARDLFPGAQRVVVDGIGGADEPPAH